MSLAASPPYLHSAGQDLTTSDYWTDEWSSARAGAPERSVICRHPLPPRIAGVLNQTSDNSVDVLEIGCAPGTILSQCFMLRPQDRYHGIDFSRFGLAQTRRYLARRRIDATLFFGDVRKFQPARGFGLVYSCGLVEHFTEPVHMVRHHARLCAPGGLVAVSVPNYTGWIQRWFINRLDPEAFQSHNLQIMRVAALRQALIDAGLRDVVAGCDGPPLLRSRAARRTLRTMVLKRIAQMWNLANVLGPRLSPCGGCVWAYGRTT